MITIDVTSSSVTYPADSLGREITFTTDYLFTLKRRYYVLLDSGTCGIKSFKLQGYTTPQKLLK